jgi:hypothetical protein
MITLPANPDGFNVIEQGSIFFRRLDTVAARKVTVVAVINGTMRNIDLPIGTDVVHWFLSVFDGGFGSTTFYFQQSSQYAINQSRVTRPLAITRANSNLNLSLTNYIGQTVGGWVLNVGDSLVAPNQSNTIENAVYVVQSNGGLSRRSDFAIGTNIDSYLVPITSGDSSGQVIVFSNRTYGQGKPAIAGYDSIDVSPYFSSVTPLTGNFVLSGDVTSVTPVSGVASSTVNNVGGQTAASVATGVIAANAATSANTVSTIMSRDSSGNTAVGQVTLNSAATLPNHAARLSQVPVLPTVDTLNVYVSAVGSDTVNIGTIISPFLTLSKADTIVTGSGNVWISTGSYTSNFSATKDNVAWSCSSNNNNYKCTIAGNLTIAGSVVRRSFKGIQFTNGTNPCITHTSTQGILNFENCSFISTNASGLLLGSGITTNMFNYFTNCDFGGLSGTANLVNNTNNTVSLNCTLNSSTVTLVSGTLTPGTFITGTAFISGTLVLASLGNGLYLMSNPALSSGATTCYNAVVWYVTGCGNLKLNIGTGHLVLGYNNPTPTITGNTGQYLETSRPIVTTVSNVTAMLSQTYATFGGLGCITKVTSDSTASNNGLWQCVGYNFSVIGSWLQLSTIGNSYSAGTGLTLTGSTFSITPQTASRVLISDSSGNLTTSSVTSSTLGFMDATSSVQTQLNGKVSTAQNERTVKVVTTSTFTLSGSVSIDGVVANPGDEVLVASSSSAITNGIWTVQSGAWIRSAQMPTGSDPFKAKIFVSQGTQNSGSIWSCLNAAGSVIGTSTITISKLNPSILMGLYTSLTGSLGSADVTIPVASTVGFPSYGLVMIGSEVVYYGAKTGTSLTSCVRGSNGTTAAAFNINTYVQFLSEEVPYLKSGADFTVSTNPQRVYRSHVWMSGSATAVRTWYPYQIPWVYADITAAELACVFWIQQLTMFFKDMENDNQYDQLIGALPSFIVSRINGNYQLPDANTDMDNSVGPGVTTYPFEWYELIVGRNQAGTELYTMSFTLALISGATYDANTLFPFRIIWQTTRGAGMVGFNGQTVVAIAGTQPRCTAYGTGGVAIPAAAFPIWAMPVSIESLF